MLCINVTRDKCEECFIQLIQGLCFTSRPGIYSCCTQTCGLIVSIIIQLDEYKFRSPPHHGDEMVSRSIYRKHHRTEETMVGHMAATGCGHPCESAEGWLLHQAQSSSQQNTSSSSSLWLSCHLDQVWVTHIRHHLALCYSMMLAETIQLAYEYSLLHFQQGYLVAVPRSDIPIGSASSQTNLNLWIYSFRLHCVRCSCA